jgi:hypothetical protein
VRGRALGLRGLLSGLLRRRYTSSAYDIARLPSLGTCNLDILDASCLGHYELILPGIRMTVYLSQPQPAESNSNLVTSSSCRQAEHEPSNAILSLIQVMNTEIKQPESSR